MFSYDSFADMQRMYNMLYDDLSRSIFQIRLLFDIDPSLDTYFDLAALSGICTRQAIEAEYKWIQELVHAQTPIYLYGAAVQGKLWYQMLEKCNVNIKGFIDKKYDELKTFCDLPVYGPQFALSDEVLQQNSIILVTSIAFQKEIYDSLITDGVPASSIIQSVKNLIDLSEQEYFDFFSFAPLGGAFVDGGSVGCDATLRFMQLSQGSYSEIYIFEPDKKNAQQCREVAICSNLRDTFVIEAALGDKCMSVRFSEKNSSSSCIDSSGNSQIDMVTLDAVLKDKTVSFIKMDIEGSELSAIQGGKKIIQRDRPMCAICVYHRYGDMLTIMSQLRELVPEYQFALRHYTNTQLETVLYAFIASDEKKLPLPAYDIPKK